jgi:hypothetical protein
MKSNKVWLFGFVVAIVMICFAISTADAQDLSGWVGKWFKINYSAKGYETTGEGSYIPRTENGTDSPYLKITAWDTTDPSDLLLRCSLYDQDYDEEVGQIIVDIHFVQIHYLGGTDLDFLCLGFIADSEGHEQFTVRITGKASGGILKSATFKTLGGFGWEKNQNDSDPRKSWAGGLTITGSLISESKLPSWVPK